MNHLEFIEKNVRELLVKQGFPLTVAQGGGLGKRLIYISACLRPVKKAQCSMTFSGMQKPGQISRFQKP